MKKKNSPRQKRPDKRQREPSASGHKLEVVSVGVERTEVKHSFVLTVRACLNCRSSVENQAESRRMIWALIWKTEERQHTKT